MGGDVLWAFHKNIPVPKERDGTFPPATISNRLEVGSVHIPLKEPVLAPSTLPEELLTLINVHERGLEGVSPKPVVRTQALPISKVIQNLNLIQQGPFMGPEISTKVRPQPFMA